MTIKSNMCPYCGGPYSITQSCNGPRTETPGENCCAEMAAHARLVSEACEEEEDRAPVPMLRRWRCSFRGRKDGAIGIYYDITTTIDAASSDDLRRALVFAGWEPEGGPIRYVEVERIEKVQPWGIER